jgi:outer membrane protein TolC
MKHTILFISSICLSATCLAQEAKTMQLTVRKAVEYALENSIKSKEAEIDVIQAKKEVWIQASRGLPIVNGSIGYTNFIDLPTSIIPAETFGAPAGSPAIEAQFGQSNTMDAGLSAGLQLFDGSYIIGVKGARGFEKLRKDQAKMTKNEVETIVAQAYYTSQIAKENVKLLNQNIENVRRTLTETIKLYKEGFVEEMDVEQLDLLTNSLQNRSKMAARQHAATLNLLKYHIGMDIKTPIELSDNLETIWALESDSTLLGRKFNLDDNLAYDLAQQDVVLHGYLVKLEEANYYPQLRAFFNYKQQAFRDKFDFQDFSQSWYPQTLWGIQLNVPIWDNLGGVAAIKKAKLEQEKVRNRLYDLEQALTMQYITAVDDFNSALEQLENSTKNIDLAERIQKKTLIRYNEGLASSMELTTAENQLITAQTEYISTLFNAMDAKLKLKTVVDND